MTRIDTVDQLNALPIGSVILDLDRDAWQKRDNGAWSLAYVGVGLRFTAEYLPATVLHVPGRDLVQEAQAGSVYGVMSVADVLAQYEPGDPWTWAEEFAHIWTNHATYMVGLVANVSVYGIHTPILLGNDGRLWDGHHRLAIAVALMHEVIPTERAVQEDS